ncbi:MAG: hypothetical protein P0107_06120 [Nitrosomonas sp.]|nr:hypothetical protein [Nitrosomonas sp.]
MNNAALRHWKQQQRARLRELRQQVPVTQRMLWSDAITAVLTQGFPFLEQRIGFYWPHQGEYDPIPAMTFWRTRGATCSAGSHQ